MAVNGINSSDIPIVPKEKIGFAGLDSEDFLKLLITQLQNQDPSEPIGNEELLNQLSMMRNLQSNIEMGDALKAITVNQRLSTAANFIGKHVKGLDESQQNVAGIADRAFLRGGQAYIGVGSKEMPLDSVLEVVKAA